MRASAVIVALLVQGVGVVPYDVGSLAVAPPLTIADVPHRILHGEPSRLSWSPDGSTLYIQSRDGVGDAAKVRHFAFELSQPRVVALDEEPAWAADYWRGKVTESAPGLPWLKIDVSVDRQQTRVAPLVGGFASAGTPTGSDAASTMTLTYVALSYLGTEIARWMADEPEPGLAFGWGPPGSGALVFVDRQGRLTLMDKERRLRVISRVENVILPAWSPDGNYVAFLQREGHAHYRVASVALLRADSALR